jgi:4-hydroxy-2-oxoheptanedioate aldolase
MIAAGWKHGYHVCLADAEHNPGMSVERLLNLRNGFMALQAEQQKECEFGVRVPVANRDWLQHLADGGVRLFVIPMIDTAEQAAEVVSMLLYPPLGKRGGAGHMPCNLYGGNPQYYQQANENMCVVVQAETPKALGNLPAISAVAGVDMVFFGPFDLHITSDKGFRTGDLGVEQTIKNAVAGVQNKLRSARFGIMEPREDMLWTWFRSGIQFVATPDTVLVDRVFAKRAQDVVSAFNPAT